MIKYGDQTITNVKIGESAISLVKLGDQVIFGGFSIDFCWQCTGDSEDYIHGGFTIHHTDGTVENYTVNVQGGDTSTKSYTNVLYIEIKYFESDWQTFNIITDDAPCIAYTDDGAISGNFLDLMINKLYGTYSESNPISVWLLGDCETDVEAEQ